MEQDSQRTPAGANSANAASVKADPRNVAPSMSLPKGGGALRSIDEKFAVNAANGTAELTVPLPFSRTRSGLDSSLALRYSSGSGNSPFGLGWALTLPNIQRRTDKKLPRYEDARESDVFLLAGAEDLVPAFVQNGAGGWQPDSRTIGPITVQRYRPRIEGAFARIEKLTVAGEAGFYWKVTSRDNIVTLFGRTAAARLTAPGQPDRIFRWLPEWMYDDRGNCLEFVYKDEDLAGVPNLVEEKARRSGAAPFANKYLKRIRYGNTSPYYPDPQRPFDPPAPQNPRYLFEATLDYGEHDESAPTPAEVRMWPCRFDPFSDCRAGFDVRSYRLCRRILFFQSLAEQDFGLAPYLVRSLDLTYQFFHFDNAPYVSQEVDLVTAITPFHYRKTAANTYASKPRPALSLTYQPLQWDKTVRSVAPQELLGAPSGASGDYQFLDLYSEGVPGILTEQAFAWYYKSNLGDGRFTSAAAVVPKPSFNSGAAGQLQFLDLDANGTRQAVSVTPSLQGYFELSDHNEWLPFRFFDRRVNVDISDPNTRLIDLDGDGRADLLISEEYLFRWHPSLGTGGYDAAQYSPRAMDEEAGPAVVFADGTQTIFLADMNGDGLADIVRVRNGEVCYWPNLGYGRFGARVSMRNAPQFDTPEQFDPARVQFGDISGTGAADLIYLGRGGFTSWINLSGNAWSDAQPITPFPGTEAPNRVSVLDLLGNGTVSIVWSSELPANATAPLRYVDLMGGKKPYVLCAYTNNLGKTARLEYRSSSYYALLDKQEGRPWATKLPFPTMCVSRAETADTVASSLFVTTYRYRHGYYDHAEREFRGFGMVEETDSESFDLFRKSGASNAVDAAVHQPPVRRRTWFHVGAYIDGAGLLGQFAADYYQGATPEAALPDAVVEADSPTPEELRQAARACKGMMLRQEVYADDDSAQATLPYTTAQHNCHVRMLQPMLGNRYAVFLSHDSEGITYNYERDASDPRIAHELNTVLDELGNVVESASVVYGRLAPDATLPAEVQTEQARIRATYTVRRFTNDLVADNTYRLRLPAETRTFELTGIAPLGTRFTPDEIRMLFLSAATLLYEQRPHVGLTEKRLFRHERSLFASNANVNQPLSLGTLESLALPYENYRLAFTATLLDALYSGRVDPGILAEGNYVDGDAYKLQNRFPATDASGLWWARSGTAQYPPNPDQRFYLPDRYIDPRGATTSVRYFSNYFLLVDQLTDALNNTTTVLSFDFRLLEPSSIRDTNDNIVDASFDVLGLVAGTAIRGKGGEADDLVGFQPDLSQPAIDAFRADPLANGAALLKNATSRFIYDFSTLPVLAAAITRETHAQTAQAQGVPARLQYAFEYSNGLGRLAMKKIQAEPGKANRCDVNPDGSYTITVVDTSPGPRWVGTGRTVVNNKDKTVMQFEPYFSATAGYETAPQLVESGVTPVLLYDPLGRLQRTQFPDGSYSLTEFDAWYQSAHDQNDNVLGSNWYSARIGGGLGPAEQLAAQKTALHDSTPALVHLSSLGQSLYSIEHNRFRNRLTNAIQDELYPTLTTMDIAGNRLTLRDPRSLTLFSYAYDMLDRADSSSSADAGQRRTFYDVSGLPLYQWDAKGNRIHRTYDALRRPTQDVVLTAANATIMFERFVYGTDKTKNQNTRLLTHYDKSGRVTCDAYDFKGNLVQTTRTFTSEYSQAIDWTVPGAIQLQPQAFHSLSVYDALNRVIQTVTPDATVTAFTFSEAALLTRIDVGIQGGALQPFVTAVRHDAKGQRLRIDRGNGTSTMFDYDPLTFRVRRIRTAPGPGSPSYQDLNYTYDPSGNITQIRDDAQQTIFFNNQVINPQNDFTYDAIYRIVAATGREHVGQDAPVSEFDEVRVNPPSGNDITALRNYLQQYDYDASGNLLKMAHSSGLGPYTSRWTRQFSAHAANNRLDSSQVGATTESYTYDAHGNITGMPGMSALNWDYSDQLHSVALGGGGTAYYTYDGQGNRVRKVIERLGGSREERLYLGTVELFTITQGGGPSLQRWSVHVMDGQQRLAIIDTRTVGNDGTPAEVVRYQYSNHLGTATLEIDNTGAVLSYEEYYPFGSTSFQGLNASGQWPIKRYRYTGKERDEETGLYYHGARYYAPWLARWTACDPGGAVDGSNLYVYSRNNPIRYADRTGLQSGDDDDSPKPQTKDDDADNDPEKQRKNSELSTNYFRPFNEMSIWSEENRHLTLSAPNAIYASVTQSLGFAPDAPVNDFLDLEVNAGIMAGWLAGKGDPNIISSAGGTLPALGLNTLQLSWRSKYRIFSKDVILGMGFNVQSTSSSGLDVSGYTTQITAVPTINVPLLKKGDFGLGVMTGIPAGFFAGASHGGLIGATPTLVGGWEPDDKAVNVDVNLATSIYNTNSWSQGPNLNAPFSVGGQASVSVDLTGTQRRHVLLLEANLYYERELGGPGTAVKGGGGIGYAFNYRDDKLNTRHTSSLGINLNYNHESGNFGGGNAFISDWFGLTLTSAFRQW